MEGSAAWDEDRRGGLTAGYGSFGDAATMCRRIYRRHQGVQSVAESAFSLHQISVPLTGNVLLWVSVGKTNWAKGSILVLEH